MLPTKFQVNWPFGSGTILAFFDLKVTPLLPTKFRDNWPRDVGGVDF